MQKMKSTGEQEMSERDITEAKSVQNALEFFLIDREHLNLKLPPEGEPIFTFSGIRHFPQDESDKVQQEAPRASATTSTEVATHWQTDMPAPSTPLAAKISAFKMSAAIKAAAHRQENALSVLGPYLDVPKPKVIREHNVWKITCDLRPMYLKCRNQLPSELHGNTTAVQNALGSLWKDEEYLRLYHSLPEEGVEVTFWHPAQDSISGEVLAEIVAVLFMGFLFTLLFWGLKGIARRLLPTKKAETKLDSQSTVGDEHQCEDSSDHNKEIISESSDDASTVSLVGDSDYE